VRPALQRLKEYDRDVGYVIDRGQRYFGAVSVDSLAAQLKQSEPRLTEAFLNDVPTVDADTPLNELIGVVAASPFGVPVVDGDKRYLGVITKAGLLETLNRESA
jgi:glycine betaine/proline transport system ATP-binding protein